MYSYCSVDSIENRGFTFSFPPLLSPFIGTTEKKNVKTPCKTLSFQQEQGGSPKRGPAKSSGNQIFVLCCEKEFNDTTNIKQESSVLLNQKYILKRKVWEAHRVCSSCLHHGLLFLWEWRVSQGCPDCLLVLACFPCHLEGKRWPKAI